MSSNASVAAQLKAFSLNQGVSTGVSQVGVDEEIILQLKKVKD
jgi:hypothetical protein